MITGATFIENYRGLDIFKTHGNKDKSYRVDGSGMAFRTIEVAKKCIDVYAEKESERYRKKMCDLQRKST